jgi:predicted transcriptional regulator
MAKSKRGSDRYTVGIPDDLKAKMLSLCKTSNQTPSQVIREALIKYLDSFKEGAATIHQDHTSSYSVNSN